MWAPSPPIAAGPTSGQRALPAPPAHRENGTYSSRERYLLAVRTGVVRDAGRRWAQVRVLDGGAVRASIRSSLGCGRELVRAPTQRALDTGILPDRGRSSSPSCWLLAGNPAPQSAPSFRWGAPIPSAQDGYLPPGAGADKPTVPFSVPAAQAGPVGTSSPMLTFLGLSRGEIQPRV